MLVRLYLLPPQVPLHSFHVCPLSSFPCAITRPVCCIPSGHKLYVNIPCCHLLCANSQLLAGTCESSRGESLLIWGCLRCPLGCTYSCVLSDDPKIRERFEHICSLPDTVRRVTTAQTIDPTPWPLLAIRCPLPLSLLISVALLVGLPYASLCTPAFFCSVPFDCFVHCELART